MLTTSPSLGRTKQKKNASLCDVNLCDINLCDVKPCDVSVCVWNICKDVTLHLWSLIDFAYFLLFSGTNTPLLNYTLHLIHHYESPPAGSSYGRPWVSFCVTSFSRLFSPFFNKSKGDYHFSPFFNKSQGVAADHLGPLPTKTPT